MAGVRGRIGAALRRAGDVSAAAAGKVTSGRPAKTSGSATPAKAGSRGGAAAEPAKKAPAKKASPAVAKKRVVKEAPATKAPATKAPAAKKAAESAPATKAPASKAATSAPAKKTAATKAPGTKAATSGPAKKAPATKAPATKAPAKKAPATKAPAIKTPAGTAPAATADKPAAPRAKPTGLNPTDLSEIRTRLQNEQAEMRAEYEKSIAALNDLTQFQGDGAGDDQADAGSKAFEREQEQSIAANRHLLLSQIEHALERIDSGTYGICEDCGRPIPAARLKALPMATLDAECKARAERR
jgi:RNA polymerase-binding transcription factor